MAAGSAPHLWKLDELKVHNPLAFARRVAVLRGD